MSLGLGFRSREIWRVLFCLREGGEGCGGSGGGPRVSAGRMTLIAGISLRECLFYHYVKARMAWK